MYYPKLYHCTTEENFYKIMRTGKILPLSSGKLIYLTTDPVEALMFTHMHHATQALIDGKPIRWLYMFEIEGDCIDWDMADEGCDHSPVFFKAPVVVYKEPIPVYWSTNMTKHDLNDLKTDSPIGQT